VRGPMINAYSAATLVSSVVGLGFGAWWFVHHNQPAHDLAERLGVPLDAGEAPGVLAGAGVVPEAATSADQLAFIDVQIKQLQSADAGERRRGAFFLSGFDPAPERREEVAGLLRNMTASEIEDDRAAALKPLGRWGDDSDFARMVALLDDPSDRVADAAATSLAATKRPEAAKALLARFTDPRLREIVGRRLPEFGTDIEADVAAFLANPDDDVKLAAALILQSIGTRDSAPAFEEALTRAPRVAVDPSRPFGPEADLARRKIRLYDSMRFAADVSKMRPGASERRP
jgi:hypothetical protein